MDIFGLVWFGLVLFYGILTVVCYAMPNQFYKYKQFYFKQFSSVEVDSLNVKTILFQTIQLTICMKFKCQNNSLSIQFNISSQFNKDAFFKFTHS